jgi:hypothetical protein
MSSNTATMTDTSAGMTIGVIIGAVVILMIAVVMFMYMRRRSASAGAAPVPTVANGLGVMNKGPNIVPRTNMNMNSGSRIQ